MSSQTSQFALPLAERASTNPSRIIVGNANASVVDGLFQSANWPYKTAILYGPPRSGKSLLARWFNEQNVGSALDDADKMDETDLFHLWNRAQAAGKPLLLISGTPHGAWKVRLPDLASRLGAALNLSIEEPNDSMVSELLRFHAELRGLVFDDLSLAYLVPRCERSHAGVERVVETIDRLSLERKLAPSLALCRDALDHLSGEG